MKKRTTKKTTSLTQKGLALLLAVIMTLGILPGTVFAVTVQENIGTPPLPSESHATEGETSAPTAEAPETSAPATETPEGTTVPATEVPEGTTAPVVEDTDDSDTLNTEEPTEYEKLMDELTALEEEAKTLEATVEVLDEFTARLRDTWNKAYDLNEEGLISDEELEVIDAKASAILAFLKSEYGYENGVIEKLAGSAGSKDGDKLTNNANGAIKFWLFNYDATADSHINHQGGTNTGMRPIASHFTFRDSTNFPSTAYPSYYGSLPFDVDGYPYNHATVARKLDNNGYPILALRDQKGNTGTTSVDLSLAYLFNPNSTDSAVHAYAPSNSILQKSGNKYVYNSANNAVDYDSTANVFRVRNYVERTDTTAGYTGYSDFLPFTYTDGESIGTNATNGNAFHANGSYAGTKPVDYWFGMVMEVDFYMPKGGKVNGEEMIFKFSGDDDVWVFIDDVLVLDLGGTHGTVDGTINFATGEIQQYLSWNGGNSNNTTGDNPTSFPTTIKNCYTAAGSQPNANAKEESWNSAGTSFSDYSKHTLKFFYLERGAGVANCKLDFNLPTLPDGGVSVTKELTDDSVLTDFTQSDEYTFQLSKWNNATESFEPVTQKAYTIGSVSGKTDENGHFKLKQSETAIFAALTTADQGVKYRIQEVGTANASLSTLAYSGNLDADKYQVNTSEKYVDFMVYPDDKDNKITHMAVFENKLNTTDVTVSKTVDGNMGDRNKAFTFTATLTVNGEPFAFPAPENGEQYTKNDDGTATFTLKHGDTITLNDIPLGAKVEVSETVVSGYETSFKVDGAEQATEGITVTFENVSTSHSAEFINTKNVTIDTGISLDSIPYILILVGVIGAAGFLFLRRRRSFED